MVTYTARSAANRQICTLSSKTERGAKAEARRAFSHLPGGSTIYLEIVVDGVRLPVAAAVIGKPGWEEL